MVILLCASLSAWSEQGPLLAAASSLRTLWPELIERYTADTGNPPPRPSFASSGLLSTQILNGAPFELFLSADLASIDRLSTRHAADSVRVYAHGTLCLVTPISGKLSKDPSLQTLARQLGNGQTDSALRVAMPNPVHAPYGRASREALMSVGIWPLPDGQLLAAENAAQTLQFVKSGAVDAALVPRSLLSGSSDGIVYAPLPADSHAPVQHVVALLGSPSESASDFYHWLLSEQSHQILRDAGLDLPDQ